MSLHPLSIMRRILTLVLDAAAALVLAGCGGPITITDWYSPPKITTLPQGVTIAVFQFYDKRAVTDGKLVGQVFRQVGDGRRRSFPIYSDELVASNVTRAFADAFNARGFPVIDRTAVVYTPEKAETGAKVAVSGDIVMFRVEEMDWLPNNFDIAAGPRGSHATCAVLLYLHDMSSGERLWQKEYRRDYEQISSKKVPERGLRNKTPAGQVLADVVEEVIYDPEFTLTLRRIALR